MNHENEEASSTPEVEIIEVDQHQGSTVLNHKFFSKLFQKYEHRQYCEEIEFIKGFGGVCSILKTLQSNINRGINSFDLEERKVHFG